MALRIEDYAVIGNCESTALVGRDGSIDWLCLPRFDSAACFAALLGTPENGRWLIAPSDAQARVRRRYRDGTLILETEFTTDTGQVTLIDCMLPSAEGPALSRQIVGRRGTVAMRTELILRFGYGQIEPWVTRLDDGRLRVVAGPDLVVVASPVRLEGHDLKSTAEFTVPEGQTLSFALAYGPSHEATPRSVDVTAPIARMTQEWQEWTARCTTTGRWAEPVQRSLVTLKGLTYRPTGGIVAAATASLPEKIGGARNWDYRYCWLRDASFTLHALTDAGYHDEAIAWRDWLLRAAAGSAAQLQIVYGIAGERRLEEWEAGWLPGYEGSRPVRVGNAASGQVQLDIYGEIISALYHARTLGYDTGELDWPLQQRLVEYLATIWEKPDHGIWEVRGERQHFTHSKVMAWVAVDRAIKTLEMIGGSGPLDRWKALRQTIHDEVCDKGFDRSLGSFVQHYGAKDLDAALLRLPLVGFLPAEDPRMLGTVAAIERGLVKDGLVHRYLTESGKDGLPPGEGVFLACSFWLADNYVLMGRLKEARALFERLLDLRNDVGLLTEEYAPEGKRQTGNLPQAFSHVALVNTAHRLTRAEAPAAPTDERGAAA
jgi:GH15 family glucan-1,4-alpha-glucosidase